MSANCYAIEAHYVDGTVDIEAVFTGTKDSASERARAINATFARALARGDIADDDCPWIWIIAMNDGGLFAEMVQS